MDDFQAKIKRKNLSEIIINRLMEGLLSGELKAGDKLPTEAQMADLFGVGRNSVREATKILEAMGIVEIFRSDGVYIVKKYNKDILNPRIYGMILERSTEKEVLNTLHTFFISILTRQIKSDSYRPEDQINTVMEKLRMEINNEQSVNIIIDLTDRLKFSMLNVKENIMKHILRMLLDISMEYRCRMIQELKSQGNLKIILDYFDNLQQIAEAGKEYELIKILSVDITNCEYFTKIFNENC